MNKLPSDPNATVQERIETRIAEYDDWRSETLATVRQMILAVDQDIVEEWKWNIPVWNKGGILCTGEVYKNAVKLTFPKGASLPDPKSIFNSSLAGNARRAIDIKEGEKLPKAAFTALIKAAIKLNAEAKPKKK